MIARSHKIDDKEIRKMLNLFPGGPENPIYIALCPDEQTAKAFKLQQDNIASSAQDMCNLYVGYADFGAVGTVENTIGDDVDQVLIPRRHSHNTRSQSNRSREQQSLDLPAD